MASNKPVHTLVLDTGAIIRNEPSISTLLSRCESIVTVPAIVSEIKDAATRSRVETTLRPFLQLRSPTPASVKFVTDFARRTGDLTVLSKPDIDIIALTYEIECERNGGDWRLRRVPGQKGLNGAPPSKTAGTEAPVSDTDRSLLSKAEVEPHEQESTGHEPALADDKHRPESCSETNPQVPSVTDTLHNAETGPDAENELDTAISRVTLEDEKRPVSNPSSPRVDSANTSASDPEDSDSDSDGWITPSNLKKQQAKDAAASTVQAPEAKTMQVAVLTTDFAMQNVIMQINLNLLSSSLARVKHLKTFILRCHACFNTTKEMSRQFCPRCGQPSLTRVSCSTAANGEFRLHLKKNMQWNSRGDKYSIPKPVHGSANGKIKGGGKGGWGNELILAEDQKEYQTATRDERRRKERNPMDDDFLPGILTGDRTRAGGRIKVGAGRNVNARKR